MTLSLRALERLFLPNACVACDEPVPPRDPDALVCDRCRLRLTPLLGGCTRCRQPLPPIGPCRFCLTWPPALTWARSAVWLDYEARRIVHGLKYQGYSHLAVLVARVMVRYLPRPVAQALVPVPLAPRRQRARGYNQAALIARALAVSWDLPVREELLTRLHDRPSQTALTPQARLANVSGAFAATRRRGDGHLIGRAPRPGTPLEGHPAGAARPDAPMADADAGIVLVDDVLTTGATLCAAASALAESGWTSVGAVTFARALPVERRVIETRTS